MGADNWAICPKCRVAAIKVREKLYSKAEKAYGSKSADEYLALRAEAEKPLAMEQTLREDYGLGVGIDGVFGVGYRARCTTCGFSYEYQHNETAITVDDRYTEDATADDPYGYNYRRSA
jgi:hypothetical protein